MRSIVVTGTLLFTIGAQAAPKLCIPEFEALDAHAAHIFKFYDVNPYIQKAIADRNPAGSALSFSERRSLVEAGYQLYLRGYVASLDKTSAALFLQTHGQLQSLTAIAQYMKSNFPETTDAEISQMLYQQDQHNFLPGVPLH